MTATGCSSPVKRGMDDVLRKLLDYANNVGALNANEAWSLAAEESARLADALGFVPPGGWHALVELAAGTDLFDATPTGFVPCVAGFAGDDEGARQLLLSAFTRNLCPPGAMAALLVALDIPPLVGLGAVGRLRPRATVDAPHPNAQPAVTRASANITNAIAQIETNLQALQGSRVRFDEIVETVALAVPHSNHPALLRMLTADLLSMVFVPAGFAVRRPDSTVEFLEFPCK